MNGDRALHGANTFLKVDREFVVEAFNELSKSFASTLATTVSAALFKTLYSTAATLQQPLFHTQDQ